MNTLRTRINNLNAKTHAILAVVAFAMFRLTNIALDAMYARSQFPVSYQVGQTAFDGELIKSYYQHMIDAGTLNIYWQTQLFDYVFMLTMATMGTVIPLFIRRLYKEGSWSYRLATVASFAIPFGALCDAFENLVSFAMLAQPLSFANWLAPIYSSFAVVKFASIGTGYICVAASLGLFAIGFIVRTMLRAGRRLATS